MLVSITLILIKLCFAPIVKKYWIPLIFIYTSIYFFTSVKQQTMRPIYDKTFIIYPMESPTFHSITQANISRIQNVEKVVLFFFIKQFMIMRR